MSQDTEVTQPRTRPQSIPRLSILHMMLWMSCSAAYLAVTQPMLRDGVPEPFGAVQRTSDTLCGVIVGAMLAGSLVLVYGRIRRNVPLLQHPGHWLLLVPTALLLMNLPIQFLMRWLDGMWFLDDKWLLAYGSIWLVPTVAYRVAWSRVDEARWRFVFGLLAVFSLFHGVFYVTIWLNIPVQNSRAITWGSALQGVSVLLVSLLDLFERQRRDWLHWTGVGTFVASSGIGLLWMVARWLGLFG